MQITLVDFANDLVVYNITGISREELENKLNLFFAAENLPLKSDKPDEKVYQKGSKIMRIIFGVFVKYFKVVVSIKQQDELFSVKIVRDMNILLSGGLIGINKSRKEFTRITEAFKVHFKD
ncbi:MAG: hypothetical protein IPK57_03785 [Chitinophagaceae bacterium]|jgi:hypothetical protein|nr:hypothetical protein [Chitinophagaceae bacterium]